MPRRVANDDATRRVQGGVIPPHDDLLVFVTIPPIASTWVIFRPLRLTLITTYNAFEKCRQLGAQGLSVVVARDDVEGAGEDHDMGVGGAEFVGDAGGVRDGADVVVAAVGYEGRAVDLVEE